MSEQGTGQGTMDPTRLWQQWQDATARMWSGVLDHNSAANSDPLGLYNLWLKNVGEAQAQAWGLAGMLDPRDAWKQWFEATSGAWKGVANLGADPLGLTTTWLEMLEQARARLLVSEASPTGAFEFFKQWYDATSETWAKQVGSLFASEQFMEAVQHFLESYAGFAKTLRKANEEYFHGLQLPTRSDIARLGELIVALEEKVDRLDDAFANFQEGASQDASREALTALEGQVRQLEGSIKQVSQAVEGVQGINGLAKRLEQLERKLDALDTLAKRLDQMQRKLDAVDALAKRLDQVERKLDAVLTALEKSARAAEKPRKPAKEPAEPGD